MRTDVKLGGRPIGYVDDETDPEKRSDQVGPLDGGIDPLAGHGTFIAGLIHQACPDADIVAWRIVGSDGPVVESDLVKALEDIAELARRHRDGEPEATRSTCSACRSGYYHETPQDELFDPTMYDILRELGECGVAVVCSAGNDATARPCFPAAFTPWLDDDGRPAPPSTTSSRSSPSARSTPTAPRRAVQQRRALGPRLRPRRGGDEHDAADVPGRLQAHGPDRGVPAPARASIDPDDYSSGFALWSGTSFAAPLFAGMVAQELVDTIDPGQDGRSAAVDRSWKAVSALTTLERPA